VALICSIPISVVVYPVILAVPELPFALFPSVSKTIFTPDTTISSKYAQSSPTPPSSTFDPRPPLSVSFPAPPKSWLVSLFPKIVSSKSVPITFSILSRYLAFPNPSFITL
jgi:hypothetical protein